MMMSAKSAESELAENRHETAKRLFNRLQSEAKDGNFGSYGFQKLMYEATLFNLAGQIPENYSPETLMEEQRLAKALRLRVQREQAELAAWEQVKGAKFENFNIDGFTVKIRVSDRPPHVGCFLEFGENLNSYRVAHVHQGTVIERTLLNFNLKGVILADLRDMERQSPKGNNYLFPLSQRPPDCPEILIEANRK